MQAHERKVNEIAGRIKEMRLIAGYSAAEMAAKAGVNLDVYNAYEEGRADFPFSFIHKCALIFGIGIIDLAEGASAKLSSYVVTRAGAGAETAKGAGVDIKSLAPLFRGGIAEPYFVTYEYSEKQQKEPIATATHSGQEFNYILSGKLKIKVGEHTEELGAGDSIYYNSSTPHGMIAVGGEACKFLAVVMAGKDEKGGVSSQVQSDKGGEFAASHVGGLVCDKFVDAEENEKGALKKISFPNADKFNFAFDIIDVLGDTKPDQNAMIHISKDKTERYFSFKDFKRGSAQAANYFKSLGIKKGDKVMLVLKRHYQFWFAWLGLHKLGAVAISATHLLKEADFVYRFNAAGVSAIICTSDEDLPARVDLAHPDSPTLKTKIIVNGTRDGWHNYDEERKVFSHKFSRTEDTACGDDTLFMAFTSGTTGHPKIAEHSHKYPLGHYHTAKYWHCSYPGGMHLTISDTGWAKSLWGKIYGEWLVESGIFVYDFERFDAGDILPMFKKYNITTFCAPPTMLRLMIKEDLSRFDLSSIRHMNTAGEALNPEVFLQFEKQTGVQIMEGFGQTETTLMIGNLIGEPHKIGSMGRPVPLYDIVLLDAEGKEVGVGENGEICIRYGKEEDKPCGLFKGYYNDKAANKKCMCKGCYHTGDVAWKDEDGFIWFVGRTDDVIKSSGYRIGPFEIESVIMELPYVLECFRDSRRTARTSS
jgi:acetyl-CoA synthetase